MALRNSSELEVAFLCERNFTCKCTELYSLLQHKRVKTEYKIFYDNICGSAWENLKWDRWISHNQVKEHIPMYPFPDLKLLITVTCSFSP